MEGGKKEEIIRSYFRPTKPEGWKNDPDEWLDSQNIADVMKQYEEAYPKFKFMGTFPIDFAAPDPYQKDPKKCLQNEICSLNLKEMANSGKTKLGFVYNLDPHNKGGSHWVASFTDIPGRRSYYFDSYGFETPAQIARFMRSLTLQDPKMRLAYNANRFQYGDTECGMYCMIFIICMLEGMSFKHFCKSKFRDMEIFELRNWLFAPKDE